ncbi:MAG: type transport system ATP-binding protein [Actinomycetota bacterium]|nr:type transport system ATP-binding protein [Actinomycetota bacterium]
MTAPRPAGTVADPVVQADTVVQVRGLTKRYNERITAVDGVSMSVRRGEIYGFLGPNGAGKTTTLRMLLGLVAPTGGTVSVLGRPPGDPAALARIGSLVEGPGFYPYLSGNDNLRVVARYAGVPASRIGEALLSVDLADRARDTFATYSLGMKQRLGVAAALLKDPELVILDEPTNGLDPAGMRDMRRLVRSLGASGRTVLLSSHLLGEVQQICDRVGVIDRGRMLAESTVDQLRGGTELIVAATPPDVARAQLESMHEVESVRPYDGALRVRADDRHTALINRTLVSAGVAVTELRRDERQLEDVFLAMTDHEPDRQEVDDV